MHSWSEEATTLGFQSERQMMESLYLVKGLSIRAISKLLGPAPTQVREKLLDLGVQMRPQGGCNNEGNLKLQDLSDHELMGKPSGAIAHLYDVSPSTVIKERKRRGLSASRTRYKTEEPDGGGSPCSRAPVEPENPFLADEL